MARNKKPRKAYKVKHNERQKLKTMPSVMKWVLEPLSQMLEDMRNIGSISTDENGLPLFLDRHTGTCFPLVDASKGMMTEFRIMFDKYGADKTKLDPLQRLFDHIENDEDIYEHELDEADGTYRFIRSLLGEVTVREYKELYQAWHQDHMEDDSYMGVQKKVIAL